MDKTERPETAAIRKARADNPKMRERDLAHQMGISEAELLAAYCGETVTRIEPRVNDLLLGMEAIGEVMALTRNESAVHEKIGVYDKPITGKQHALMLGAQIDLRIFPALWRHGFAVEKRDDGEVRRSLQFFDASGEAVHKIHLRPNSDLKAYRRLVDKLLSEDQSQALQITQAGDDSDEAEKPAADLNELRDRWSRMTDVHQFVGILRKLNLSRHQAVRLVGEDFAWPLDTGSVAALMRLSANEALPIMCFVGNRGCIQIHTGLIAHIRPMGPWLNVMDPTFHLHLRLDHISEAWAVRKPNSEGHVTSVEAYDATGNLIIQFFGQRQEGEEERPQWRMLVENLPRLSQKSAA
ncbi:ChuX/HutX family heme-like substrate-binding protein [Chelativorans sp. Marseille-P2723]|uniref:hemin-degrading factor n=1 Tax=Chelativorans sp. Marseille-P2723 TaxID=2709133 RepID=UPI0015700E5C|nr:ChuX/HutX family heme-like substrate-binding protein [Chelativorans sp. Marseille-P2723]